MTHQRYDIGDLVIIQFLVRPHGIVALGDGLGDVDGPVEARDGQHGLSGPILDPVDANLFQVSLQ